MKKYNITVREFPDKIPSQRFSITIEHSTKGWYSINGICEIIKRHVKNNSETNSKLNKVKKKNDKR